MQLKPRFALLATVLAAICTPSTALSIQADGADVVQGLVVRGTSKTSFTCHGESAALMSPEDVELARRVAWTYSGSGKTLLMGVIVTNGTVATAACNTGNPLVCAIGVAYSVISFFFAAYIFSDRGDSIAADVYYAYPATSEKTVRQRLMTELEPGKWHSVGHAQHAGNNHTMEYYNGGTYHQLRATSVPFTTVNITVRADEASDGGFIGDMYWDNNNEGAYDSFDSTPDSTSFFASNSAGWMVETSHAIAACSAFADGDGILDNGIMTLGWNNKPFQWEDGEMGAAFGTCQGQL